MRGCGRRRSELFAVADEAGLPAFRGGLIEPGSLVPMASSRPRRAKVSRLPAERRIADIMLAARAVFTEKGYNDALISDIAERAGVVEGSIYRFFTNKRDLLVRVVEHWYEEMLARDDEQFAGVRGTWNKIRFIIHHHLMSIRREPALTRLVFQELRPDPDYRKTHLFQLNQTYTHRIIDVVRAADRQRRVPRRRVAVAGPRHDLRLHRAPHLGLPAQRGRLRARRHGRRHHRHRLSRAARRPIADRRCRPGRRRTGRGDDASGTRRRTPRTTVLGNSRRQGATARAGAAAAPGAADATSPAAAARPAPPARRRHGATACRSAGLRRRPARSPPRRKADAGDAADARPCRSRRR